MPELPEVETARRAATAVAVGRRIVGVTVSDDPIVFEGVPPARIRQALLGRRVRAVRRHGKHFWLELDRRPWLSVHFGMAGGLHTSRARSVRLVSSGRRAETAWPPRFTKLHLRLDDGGELAIADGRRLGRIRLRHDPATEPPIAALGFDALRGVPGAARFRALARSRGRPGEGAPARPVLRGGCRQLDRRRGALPGAHRPAPPGALAVRPGAGPAARRASARSSGGPWPSRADSERYPPAWLFHRRWNARPGHHRAGRRDPPGDDRRPHRRLGAGPSSADAGSGLSGISETAP